MVTRLTFGEISVDRRDFHDMGEDHPAARADDLRYAHQLHMIDTGVSTGVFNARIVSQRFFFGVTCAREEMKR